ncbi:PREDICTED: sodium channel protein type 4 subunit alpha B-like isoform X3 [Branchiostoma belcheri]|uniref:Sodium channel protein n=2 Tax=Branchiostoma belcheri TaxID=7741 RepID=A0A6P4Y9R2_BRABE|nr:PREDICTED: sodium channel protein type 4 subunit alpha B-like isoform X3 [Branchiostoma belcheri]
MPDKVVDLGGIWKALSPQTLKDIEARIKEEEKRKKERQEAGEEEEDEEVEEIQPNKKLEAGQALPDKYGEVPIELVGRPIEEIDDYYKTKWTFVVIAKDRTIFRFSTTHGCFILSPFNPLRRLALFTLTHSLFSTLVMLTILVNCVFMALNDPPKITEFIFNGIYTIEMLVKLSARGYVLQHFTYLRDPWNWLDFAVVVLAYITMFMDLGNLSVLRTFRVLRALKTISVVPGLKTIVNALIQSVINLRDVIILTSFGLCVFALVGLQLYMGVLRHKCVMEFPENGMNLAEFCYKFRNRTQNALPNEYIHCADDLEMLNGNGDPIEQPFGVVNWLSWSDYFNYSTPRYINYRGNITRQEVGFCFPPPNDDPLFNHSETVHDVMFEWIDDSDLCNVSVVNATTSPYVWDAWYYNRDHWLMARGLDGLCRNKSEDDPFCKPGFRCLRIGENPDFGYTSFDNIGWALLTAFRLINQDFWENLYQQVLGTAGHANMLFFLLVIFLGSFYLVNLILAVVAMSYEEASQQTEDEEEDAAGGEDSSSGSSLESDSESESSSANVAARRKRSGSRSSRSSSRSGSKCGSTCKVHPSCSIVSWTALNGAFPSNSNFLSMQDIEMQPDGEVEAVQEKHTMEETEKEKSEKEIAVRKAGFIRDDEEYDSSDWETDDEEPPTPLQIVFNVLCGWKCPPCWNVIARISFLFICDPVMELFITLCIVFNTVFMALDYHDISQNKPFEKTLEVGNYVFSGIFAGEFLFKLIGMGPKDYFSVGWNMFDSFIVILSCIEIMIEQLMGGSLAGFSVLRSFRLLRVFKLAKSWPTLNKLLSIIGNSMGALGNLTFVLGIVIYIFAVLGMQVFGECYRTWTPLLDRPRWNFEDFLRSFMIVFRVLCGEWIESMWDCMRCNRVKLENCPGHDPEAEVGVNYVCVPFFLLTVLIGNLIILNLFLALLLSSFSGLEESGDDDSGEPNNIVIGVNKIIFFFKYITYCFLPCFVPKPKKNWPPYDQEEEEEDEGGEDDEEWKIEKTYVDGEVPTTDGEAVVLQNGYVGKRPSLAESGTPWSSQNGIPVAMCGFNSEMDIIDVTKAPRKKKESENNEKESENQYIPDGECIKDNKEVEESKDENKDGNRSSSTSNGLSKASTTPAKSSSEPSLCQKENGVVPMMEKIGNGLGSIPDKLSDGVLSNGKLSDGMLDPAYTPTKLSDGVLNMDEKPDGNLPDDPGSPGSKEKQSEYASSGVIVEYPPDCWPEKWAMPCCDDCIKSPIGIKFAALRAKAYWIIEHNYFETFIIIMIVLSSGALAFEDKYINTPEKIIIKTVLGYADYAFTVIFTIEMILKMLGYGFKTYFTNAWCWLDFIIVMASLVTAIPNLMGMGESVPESLKTVRVIRALRPLRAISRAEGMKVVVNALIGAIPSVTNVLMVCLVFWLIFAIMGVQLFKGKFFKCMDPINNPGEFKMKTCFMFNETFCNDPVAEVIPATCYDITGKTEKPACVLMEGPTDYCELQAKCQECANLNKTPSKILDLCEDFQETCNDTCPASYPKDEDYTCYDGTGSAIGPEMYFNRSVCEARNKSWENYKINFDNVGIAYLSLLQIATFKGWIQIIEHAVDGTDVDKQPVRDSGSIWYLYFVIFIIFGAFFTLNLFIGVIIDNFNAQKKKPGDGDGSSADLFMTEDQKKYMEQMKKLGSKSPSKGIPRPDNNFQGFFYDVAMTQAFEVVIMAFIMFNMLTMMMEHYGSSDQFKYILEKINLVFIAVFTGEMVWKMIAFGPKYFSQGWNIFDFVVVVMSIITQGLEDVMAALPVPPTLLRVIRVARVGRILRLVKGAKGIRTLIFSLLVSLPALVNIGLLLFLIMFIYAIFGMMNFAHCERMQGLNEVINFETFFNSIILLFQVCTSAGWDGILNGLQDQEPPQINGTAATKEQIAEGLVVDKCWSNTRYTYLGIFFFVTYLIMNFLIVVNMYIAVILDNFSAATEEAAGGGVTEDDIDMYYSLWERYDPHASKYIPLSKISQFVHQLDDPLRIPKPNKITLAYLDIPICTGDRLYCKDILKRLTERAMGTFDNDKEEVDEEEEEAVTTDHPEDYQRVGSTLTRRREEVAAMVIQRAIRKYVLKHDFDEQAPQIIF